MFALLSLWSASERARGLRDRYPDHVRQDTGQPPTFFECLGPTGQEIARQWLDENPGHRLRRIQCSASRPARLRTKLETPWLE